MKKALSTIMCLCIIMSAFAVVPFGISAAESKIAEISATSGTSGNCTWELDGTVLTISGNGAMKKYYYNFPDPAPWSSSDITEVIINDGVTSIGDFSFLNCSNLKSIIISDTVTTIGASAFNGCSSLNSVTIPDSVTTIDGSAFKDCDSMTSVLIPDSVTSIGKNAFNGCSKLASLTIPNAVTTIGENAFEDTAWYNNQPDGLLYVGRIAYKKKGDFPTEEKIKDGTLKIADCAFSGCSGMTSVTIPNSVKTIGNKAFEDCDNLTSVTIGNSVTSIGEFAFNNCISLSSVKIPDSVINIEYGAFANCKSLISVTIPESVEYLGSCAFYDCYGLDSVTIPDSLTNIGGNAFDGTAWYKNQPDGLLYAGKVLFVNQKECPSEVKIKDGTVRIADSAFYRCGNLTSVIIPNSVTTIGEEAFEDCDNLTSLTIGNSVVSIGDFAFSSCSNLTSITIPDSVTEIGNRVFENCNNLTSVSLGNFVDIIGDSAFEGCSSLTSITIPDSVTTIQTSAFANCTNLTTITIPDSVTSIGAHAFDNTEWYNNQPDDLVYVGKVAYEMKGTCPDEVVIKDGTLGIANQAFSSCSNLTSVTIPETVTTIGNYAFSGCSKLASFSIPDSITTIGCRAFANTAWYNNQPEGLVYIGGFAYYMKGTCPPEIKVKDGTTAIADFAFYDCYTLRSVLIPDSVTSIGKYSFNSCSALTSVVMGNSVSNISDSAFYNCSSLTSVTVPDSVSIIGDNAFGYIYNDRFKKIDGFTIYGFMNSSAEAYAKDNDFCFKPILKQCDICHSDLFESGYRAGYPATAKQKGLTYGMYCSNCDMWLIEQELIPRTGYDLQLGDVDCDEQLTVMDATFIQYNISDMKKTGVINKSAADVDKSGEVDVADATFIQRYAAGTPIPYFIGDPIT